MHHGTADPLLLENWRGCIPIAFELHRDDARGLGPRTVFVLAPRSNYLPVVGAEAVETFRRYARHPAGALWFEARVGSVRKVALRWQFPVGVLFDMVTAQCLPEAVPLPFRVSVRLTQAEDFPSKILLPCTGDPRKVVKSHFFHSLKQALHVMHGPGKLNKLTGAEQDVLWDSLRARDAHAFTSMLAKVHSGGSSPQQNAVPIRVMRLDGTVLQPLVPAQGSGALGEALGAIVASDAPLSPSAFLVQGVPPPLDAPLLATASSLCCHDLFLYIVECPSSE